MKTLVLILSGGFGTRLREVVSDVPKPMAPIVDKPFLYYVVELLKRSDFKDICFLTGYKSEVITSYFADGDSLDISCCYSHEDEPLGTGGAIKKAIDSNPGFDNYLVLNGDTIFNIDFKDFVEKSSDENISMALASVDDPSRYGSVALDGDKVVKFIEKGSEAFTGLINGGIYLVPNSMKDKLRNGAHSIESDVFPDLVSEGSITGIPYNSFFLDIGIPDDFRKGQKLIPELLN